MSRCRRHGALVSSPGAFGRGRSAPRDVDGDIGLGRPPNGSAGFKAPFGAAMVWALAAFGATAACGRAELYLPTLEQGLGPKTGGTTGSGTGAGSATGSPGAAVTTLAGSGQAGYADGPSDSAEFDLPAGIAVDGQGNVYVADEGSSRIRKVDPQGNVSTLAGNGRAGHIDGRGGPNGAAEFSGPLGVAVDASDNVYVADSANCSIRKIDPSGNVVTLVGYGCPDGWFGVPYGIGLNDNGNIYVSDAPGNRVAGLDSNDSLTVTFGNGQPGDADGPAGNAEFDWPQGIVSDGVGNLYVADLFTSRIRKIDPSGNVTTLAGSGQPGAADGFMDGPALQAQFNQPIGIARDSSGNLFVADSNNARIRKIDPAGNVTTVAGNGVTGYADGAASDAEFREPSGVAVDAAGNLYVSDTYNNVIRKIAPF